MSVIFQPTLYNSSNRPQLYDLVTHHPEATFYIRYEGGDNERLGIYHNDILVIDRSIDPAPNKMAVIIKDGNLEIDRLCGGKGRNRNAKIFNKSNQGVEIWGIINYIIHKT